MNRADAANIWNNHLGIKQRIALVSMVPAYVIDHEKWKATWENFTVEQQDELLKLDWEVGLGKRFPNSSIGE